MSQLKIPVDPARDHIAGPETAPVTLVEYGDYECPYCGRAYPIVKRLQEAMGDQLRFVFRNFPLSEMHPHAAHAAAAAEAAAAQGKFWEMHDLLYEHQRSLSDANIERIAVALGLDEKKLIEEVRDGAYATRIEEDFMGGVRSGVNGTPTFFINGHRHNDSWDEPVLLAALQDAAKAV
ncbi:MAG: thioredoxin domain-containing protein [Capsulimonadales bacterium]|nr:thioredoxin domain-containing protein [Capsulimonadales bacterium]